jgi:dipeptidyl aminopeptidase/acylaminoacyl peptidase
VKFLSLFSLIFLFSCSNITQIDNSYKGHGSESISKEDLALYAPRPIPKELVGEIESQQEIRTPSLGKLTPDGKNMFFSWSVTGTKQVWKIDGPRRFPVQMTGGENSTYLKSITEDGKWLILSRDEGGSEYPSLYLQSVNGGELKLLYGKDKVKVSYMNQSKDGKFIYYRANDIAPTIWGIYKMNLKTKESSLLFQGKGYWFISDRLESGEMILGHLTSNVTNEYFLFNENTRKLTPLIGQGDKEYFRVKFAAKKNQFLVLTDKLSDFKRLYLYESGSYKALSPDVKMDVVSFSKSKDNKRILFEYTDNGKYILDGISAKNYKKIKLPKMGKALHTYFGSSTSNSRYTIFGQSFHNRSRSSYVYEWRTGKMTSWTVPSSPEIDTSGYVPWTEESYKAEDGTMIPMIVKRPKQCVKKSCPVIISFHGGPEGQSIPSFSPHSELFVKRGFVLVKPNVRGSRGYGKKWLNSDNGAKRLDVITDIRDSSIHVKKHWSYGGIVPKIGVTGGSYGGYSTLYAMTVFADHFDAGVARVGMSSLVTFLENTAKHRRYLRESEYGYLATDREVLEKLSPINYLDNLKNPLLIIQGANDPRVPAGEAVQFKKALDRKGIDSTLILFPDEGHGVRKRKNKTLRTGHTLNFFIKNLL